MSSNGKPTKVLHISTYPPPLAGHGMRVWFLKKEMESQNDICEVLNPRKREVEPGGDYIPVRDKFGLDYILQIFKYRLKGFVIHHHMNGDSEKGFILTFLSVIISLLTFRRPMLTFHAGPIQKYFPQDRAPKLTLYYKFIFGVSRWIVCNDENVKRNIVGYGINPDKVKPIRAFSRQYMQYETVKLEDRVEEIFAKHDPVVLCYCCFREEFFVLEMLEAYSRFREKYPDSFLLMMVNEGGETYQAALKKIEELGIADRIHMTGDLDHYAFLTTISRGTLFLRTPVKDGVCSSVLEALSLGVPVIASENNRRPEGVITYDNLNIDQMVEKMSYVVEKNGEIRNNIPKPEIWDTVAEEIALVKQA